MQTPNKPKNAEKEMQQPWSTKKHETFKKKKKPVKKKKNYHGPHEGTRFIPYTKQSIQEKPTPT